MISEKEITNDKINSLIENTDKLEINNTLSNTNDENI
jgi:hypothetical protein